MEAAPRLSVLSLLVVSCVGQVGGGGPEEGGPASSLDRGGTPTAGAGTTRPGGTNPGPTASCTGRASAGRPALRRLNRDEYTNSLRDLLGITSKPGALLPEEDSSSEGFDTNGDYLSVSTAVTSKLVDASWTAIAEAMAGSRASLVACSAGTASPATGPCAREIVTRFGKRAFRRPLTAGEIDAHVKIVTDARASGLDDDTSVKFGLQSLLLSPFFLYQVVSDPRPDDPAAVYQLDDHELATSLAFFLRGSVPDPVLMDLADRKQLQNPDVLRAQVKRLLADPASARFADSWSGQWLRSQAVLTDVNPPPSVIASFDDDLRQSMKRETDAFFENMIRSDLNPLEILTADYSFINARMAKHYGITGVTGTAASRVNVAGAHRKGVLTQASIMAATTHSGQTSPIARGSFILSQLLCVSLSIPPNLNPPSFDELQQRSTGLTVKQILESHRANAVCAGCHAEMDPIGLAFETFDPIGRYRTTYTGGMAIDSSGELPGTGQFRDYLGLVDLLGKDRKQQVERCFTSMMMSYAVGRSMQPTDQCAIDRIAGGLDDTQGISELITNVVLSDQFRSRSGAAQGAQP